MPARSRPSLTVSNPGTISSGAATVTATLVGVENNVEMYRQTLPVDYVAPGASLTLTFPGYTATTVGTINWTATVNDQDPDVDQAAAVTKVSK